MQIQYLYVGLTVDVEPTVGDGFHEFTGTVRSFRNGNAIVADQDGNCWEVDPAQVNQN